MHFRPFVRMAVCQGIAALGFVLFLLFVRWHPTVDEGQKAAAKPAAAFVAALPAAPRSTPVPPSAATSPKAPPAPAAAPAPVPKTPARPDETGATDRFRASTAKVESAPAAPALPAPAARKVAAAETLDASVRDKPLGYLNQFKDMTDFHTFLDKLPREQDRNARTMSLIRVEGLPATVADLRRLLQSYRIEPFLFNPARFNYLITQDCRLLKDPQSIQTHVAQFGRYLRGETGNIAYRELRREFIAQARAQREIAAAITDPSEFDRMELGLASAELTRFFRKLESDTAAQLSEVTGKPVAVNDISRIDCRFRNVNGAMVLVPFQAWIGTDPGRGAISVSRG